MVTDFKPGDKQLATVLRRAVHPDAPHDFDAWPADIQRMWGQAAQVAVEFLNSFNVEVDEPAPYTEPSEGDEVEITVRGVIKPTGGALCFFAKGNWLNSSDLATAVAEGRVRLVERAKPTYEPGRPYRDPNATAVGATYVYMPYAARDAREPFMHVGTGSWFAADDLGDLVPCDFVPCGEGA